MPKLRDKKLKFVQLPPHSPDLSPIENLFAVLKEELANHSEILDLSDRIAHDIEQGYVNNLVDSIPKRLDQMVKTKAEFSLY